MGGRRRWQAFRETSCICSYSGNLRVPRFQQSGRCAKRCYHLASHRSSFTRRRMKRCGCARGAMRHNCGSSCFVCGSMWCKDLATSASQLAGGGTRMGLHHESYRASGESSCGLVQANPDFIDLGHMLLFYFIGCAGRRPISFSLHSTVSINLPGYRRPRAERIAKCISSWRIALVAKRQ